MSSLHELAILLQMLRTLRGESPESALAKLAFRPIPTDAHEALMSTIKDVQEMKAEDIHAAFITLLIKAPGGRYCEQCQEVHEEEGVTQMVMVLGPADDVRNMVDLAFKCSDIDSAGVQFEGVSVAGNPPTQTPQ